MKHSDSVSPDMYLDFSQFNQMRKMSRDDKEQALVAAAKQMEGVFLNMMLQSMRDANAVFSEGNMLESRDSQFYQGMYDKQLALNISNKGGIGLADVIVRQMSSNKNRDISDALTDISQYLNNPVLSRSGLSPEPTAFEDAVLADAKLQVSTLSSTVEQSTKSSEPQSWKTPEEFIEAIYPHALKVSLRLGVEPEAIVAQAVLETGWGKHVMAGKDENSSFNLFGIKADSRWGGDITRKNTVEYRNGLAARENAAFRSYESLQHAFDDYADFLESNARYEPVLSKKPEAKQWGFDLQQYGYATDPNYGNKIANIMDSDAFQSALQSVSKKL